MTSRFDQPDHNPADDSARVQDSIEAACKFCGVPVTIYQPEPWPLCDACWQRLIQAQDRRHDRGAA